MEETPEITSKQESKLRRREYYREYMKKRRAEKVARGECINCKIPVYPGSQYCEYHQNKLHEFNKENKEKIRKNAKISYYRRIAEGQCAFCSQPQVPGITTCESHRGKSRERQIARRAAGICGRCQDPSVPGSSLCKKHADIYRGYVNNRIKKARASGKCIFCYKVDQRPDRVSCQECADKEKKKRDANLERRIAEGLCPTCGRKLSDSRVICESCFLKQTSMQNWQTGKFAPELRSMLINQNYKCIYSGLPLIVGLNASLDHKIPVSRGGPNTLENCQWTLRSINYMKRELLEHDFFVLVESIYRTRVAYQEHKH